MNDNAFKIIWLPPRSSWISHRRLYLNMAEPHSEYADFLAIAGANIPLSHTMKLADLIEPTPDCPYVLHHRKGGMVQMKLLCTDETGTSVLHPDGIIEVLPPGEEKYCILTYDSYSALLEERLGLK